ncbi:tRNA (cytosine(38)-C(5))-methyltransferase isoform X1 [Bombina bombina]|uniref:tRNA (cytosine(38)-C(5))-methyltransferase isoform X1 n=1 Tax=Bombina bombina TaxID=8345 RepID=UPI00235A8079|nr:tRNA (cytosine(38)-C(5))-methyltransferase isoform X1 [Bombina bombina]
MASLRVLELYSGIGGMHCGLTESGVSANIVAAVDVNTTANEVYRYNFPKTPLWPKSIEGITLKELDALAFDMILMSPPCQPFTRIGLQADVSDPRAKSFLYILDILPRLKKTPSYILLENVKGFESSIAREALVQTLEKCGYRYQEFLLSPTCLGIPNSRLRYFLIAKLQKEPFAFQTTNKILEEFPLEPNFSSSAHCLEGNVQAVTDEKNMISYPIYVTKQCSEGELLYKLETAGEMQRKLIQDNDSSVRMLEDFLETNVKDLDQYFLPSKSLLRYALILDIVKPTCRRSTCFTKGYGHYVEGTGSVIQTATDVEIESVYKSLDNLSQEEKLAKLATLKMRYFTPREIANLHGFPSSFGFPEKITTKQRYRLLGNSLNVHIVANLISILLH